MTNNSNLDVIVSTVAVVIEPASSQQSFVNITSETLKPILKRPINIGQAPGGQLLAVSSNRDQIEVQLSPNKIDVRDVSGNPVQASLKVPPILHKFLDLLERPRVLSYGVNFVVEIPTSRPEVWIAENLLNPNLTEKLGDQPLSKSVTLRLDRSPKIWNVGITAQDDEIIHVNFNINENVQTVPASNVLTQELTDQFEAFRALMNDLEVQGQW